MRSAEELIAALDAACLGSDPERSLRKMGNGGIPLHYGLSSRAAAVGATTHTAGDLCSMADVIARFREEIKNGA